MPKQHKVPAGNRADAGHKRACSGSRNHTPVPDQLPEHLRKPMRRLLRRCDAAIRSGVQITMVVSFVADDGELLHTVYGDAELLLALAADEARDRAVKEARA